LKSVGAPQPRRTAVRQHRRHQIRALPEEPLLSWFATYGYQWQRDVLLTADGSDHEITLKRKAAQ
jgi:hypothetical protein